MPPVRDRRCPSCQAVRQTSEFLRDPDLVSAAGLLRRGKCPACGHVAPLLGFQVAEPPAEPDEGAPS
jgi:hypothetical protein